MYATHTRARTQTQRHGFLSACAVVRAPIRSRARLGFGRREYAVVLSLRVCNGLFVSAGASTHVQPAPPRSERRVGRVDLCLRRRRKLPVVGTRSTHAVLSVLAPGVTDGKPIPLLTPSTL